MATAIDDLWPAEIARATGPVPPIAILKQQASLLGQRTKNLVEAEVETKTADYQRILRHTFNLVAPVLNFYRYPLLTVEHYVTQMYPATIKVTWIDKEFQNTVQEITAADADEFKDGLRRVFGDPETKKVIAALLVQSEAKKEPEVPF